MTARKRPKRRRDRGPRQVELQLPDLPIQHSDDGSTSADDARSALTAAEQLDSSAAAESGGPDGNNPGPSRAAASADDGAGAPAAAHTPVAPQGSRDRAAASNAPTSAPTNPHSREDGATPAGSLKHATRTIAGGGRASLTGKQYKGLKVEQLRTVLALRDTENAQLREQLAETAPIAAAATDETLATACGETWSTIADVAAIFVGQTARITPEQKQRLGALWAPAIRPYMGAAAVHAPLLAAVGATAGIAFEKYWTVRAEREAAAAEAKERT